MKKLLPFLFLLVYTGSFAQLSEKQLKELHENTAKAESSRVQLEAGLKETQRVMDSINRERFSAQNTRNLNAFMAEQTLLESKKKRSMYWRIGLGILMVIIMAVAVWRRMLIPRLKRK